MDTTRNLHHPDAFAHGTQHVTDFIVNEKIATAVRRKIPERMTNSKGSGAYGTFTVTHDISAYCKAHLFSKVGNECRIFVRFSAMQSEKGSADNARDVRGFALRFYTDEGNWDLVGNNMPVFYVKDARNFALFDQSQSRDPRTNIANTTRMWDFFSGHPETLHQLLMLMSDRGTSAGYRHIHGFGAHTFSFTNLSGEKFWVKFHYRSKQGACKSDGDETCQPDFAQEDLLRAIEAGDFPKWTLFIQVMTQEEARNARWNPFDVTKVWLHEDFPLIEVGELVLNEIPQDYFSHVEQAAFSPANIIPGIGFSPDRLLQARLFSYADAHRHRVGINAKELEVNASKKTTNTAFMLDEPTNETAVIHYENDEDHYTQPGLFYTKALTESGRETLVKNLVDVMQQISGPNKSAIVNRQLCHFFRANIELGMGVATALNVNIDANMLSHEPNPTR